MTKKDYILIASAIAASRGYSDKAVNPSSFLHGIQALAYVLANVLAENNNRFDRETFLHLALGEDKP